jgi:hypothetical protein
MTQAQGLLHPPSSNSEETDRHNPSGADHHSVRPGCDSLPIAVSWFLPSSDGFAWEDTAAGSVRRLSQPQWPSPPRQLQPTPAGQTEFVICDHTIERFFLEAKRRYHKMGAAYPNEKSCLLTFYAIVRTVKFHKVTMPTKDTAK